MSEENDNTYFLASNIRYTGCTRQRFNAMTIFQNFFLDGENWKFAEKKWVKVWKRIFESLSYRYTMRTYAEHGNRVSKMYIQRVIISQGRWSEFLMLTEFL